MRVGQRTRRKSCGHELVLGGLVVGPVVWGLPRYSDPSLPLRTCSVIVRNVRTLLQLLCFSCVEEQPGWGQPPGGVALCEAAD